MVRQPGQRACLCDAGRGAVILGKTTITEFGASAPPPTRNPLQYPKNGGQLVQRFICSGRRRHVAGSFGQSGACFSVRLAGYLAKYALKPNYGALYRGWAHALSLSQSVLGVHAEPLEDYLETVFYISTTAGGDPGTPDLTGAPTLDRARKPIRVIRLETACWPGMTDATRAAFEDYYCTLSEQRVEIVDRSSNSGFEALEQAMKCIPELLPLLGFEAKWPMADYETSSPSVLGEKMQRMLKSGREVSIEQYRELLNIRAESSIAGGTVWTCRRICPFMPARPTTRLP